MRVVAIAALTIALAAAPAIAGYDSPENQANMNQSKPAYSGPGPGGSWGATYPQRQFNVKARMRALFGTIGTIMNSYADHLAGKADPTITNVNHGWSVPTWHSFDGAAVNTAAAGFGDHDGKPSGCPHC